MATRKPAPTARSKPTPQPPAAMLADLDRSGLDKDDAKLLGCTPGSAAALGLKPAGAGYTLPYFNRAGKRVPFYRFRYLEDTRTGFEKVSGQKGRRYSQPPGTEAEVYMPPYIDWNKYLEGDEPLLITEGEKKAACATKNGFPTLGLGGVWSFQSTKNNLRLIEELENTNWQNRAVYIAYDSDAVRNPQVLKAEQRLAHRLTSQGAEVYIVRLPPGADDIKLGLDDYILLHGIDELQHLCSVAAPYSESAALHEMNNEVIYIKDPGVVYVTVTGQIVGANDFKSHRFADRTYTRQIAGPNNTIRLEERSTAADWLRWPGRATVELLQFEPGQSEITEKHGLNMWRGWPYPPKAGSVALWDQLLGHLFKGCDAADRAWFEQWAAYPFQHPGVKQYAAVVMWGRHTGTGKSAVGYTLGDLYGDYFTEIRDMHIEETSFNSWARNKQFVMGDDITGSNNRKLANALKTMITREKLEINQKFVPQYTTRDCINYYFTSNDSDAFLLDENDRRYFVHEVTAQPLPQAWYATYATWRRSDEGRSALMHHLLYGVDCSNFNPYERPPMTASKEEMISLTRSDLEAWLSSTRSNPDLVCKKFGDSDLVTPGELLAVYDPLKAHGVTAITMAKKLKQLGVERIDPADRPPNSQIRAGADKGLVRLYALRNADKYRRWSTDALRKYYDEKRGIYTATDGGPRKAKF